MKPQLVVTIVVIIFWVTALALSTPNGPAVFDNGHLRIETALVDKTHQQTTITHPAYNNGQPIFVGDTFSHSAWIEGLTSDCPPGVIVDSDQVVHNFSPFTDSNH